MSENRFQAELDRRRGTPATPTPSAPENPADRFQAELDRRKASGGVTRQFSGGFNEQLSNFLNLPKDMTDALFDLIPGMPPAREPGAIVKFLRDNPEPTTRAQRVARRIGQEVAANVPLAAVPLGAAAAPAKQAAAKTGSVAERVVGNVVQGVRNAPAASSAGELAATVGAGAGAGAAREIAPESNAAEVTGQLIGSVAPIALAHTPTALAVKVARAAGRRISPAARREAARAEVTRVIGDEVTPAGLAGIDEAQALRRDVPGFEPTLAEQTGSPSLARTQELIESQATGRDLEALAGRRAANVAAVDEFAGRAGPPGETNPEFIVDTARRRVTAVRDRVAGQQAANVEDQATLAGARERATTRARGRQEAVAEALPTTDRAAAGASLRSRLQDIRGQASDEMSQLADDLGINDADITVQFGPAQDDILSEFQAGSIFEDVSNFPDVLDDIRRVGAQAPEGNEPVVTFRDLKALRERLTDDLLDAQGAANPSKKKIRLLVRLQQRVDGIVDDLVEESAPGLAEAYRTFRTRYFRDYIQRFEQGAAFKVRARDGRGFFRIPDEKVADAFFQPGNVTAARQFGAVFGDDPAARSALEAVALDSLRDATVRDGQIVPRLLTNWLHKRRSILAEFDRIGGTAGAIDETVTGLGRRLDDTLGNFDATAEALTARQAQLRTRARGIEDTMLARELAKVVRGSHDAGDVIDAALKNRVLLDQILGGIKNNPDAMNSFRRILWDKATAGGSAQIEAFIDANNATLRRILGPKHITDIRRILRARQMLETTAPPRGRAFRPNPLQGLENAIGMGVPQLASRVFAAESGRTSFRYVMTDWFGRFIRGRSLQDSEALLKEALYDPKVARDMAALAGVKRPDDKIAKRLNTHLLNLGFGDEEDPADRVDEAGRPLPTREDLRRMLEDQRPLSAIQSEERAVPAPVVEEPAPVAPTGDERLNRGPRIISQAGLAAASAPAVEPAQAPPQASPLPEPEVQGGADRPEADPATIGELRSNGAGTRDDPVKVETSEDVDAAAAQAGDELESKPADIKIHGLDIAIENEGGENFSAGKFKRTDGADGDAVDVYVGDAPESNLSFIIDQIEPSNGRFDKHTVMLGFPDEESAIEVYNKAFNDGSGPSRMGAITSRDIGALKQWLNEGNTKKPVTYKRRRKSKRKG